MSLRQRLLLLQVAIVVLTIGVVGGVALRMQEAQIRDSYEERMIGVAQSVATLPAIVAAYDEPDPSAVIQPIAEVIREASGVTYVVVTDAQGIRYSHPNPDRIGEMVSTDPSAPLSGRVYVGTQTGTLGESWRVKVPIFAEGEVIGSVSVGTLESTLREDLLDDLPQLLVWVLGAGLAGTLGAVYVQRLVWRRVYRMEPEEIASLREVRDAMLHGLGEGMVAVDEHGRVALANDQARQMLDLPDDCVGRPAGEVLDEALRGLLTARGEGGDKLVLVGELPAGPAQQCADAGEQLSEPEGFGHVVVGAGVQADDEVHLVRPCGEHEDRCGHPLAADPARDVEAVHVGQPEVEHDEVRVAGVVDRPLSGAEGTHVVALTRQRAGERLGDRRIVLDEKYVCHAAIVKGSSGKRVASTPLFYPAVPRRE